MAGEFDRLKAGLQRRAVGEMCWHGRARCGRVYRKSLAAMKPLSAEPAASDHPHGAVAARCHDVFGHVPRSPEAIYLPANPEAPKDPTDCNYHACLHGVLQSRTLDDPDDRLRGCRCGKPVPGGCPPATGGVQRPSMLLESELVSRATTMEPVVQGLG